MSNNPIDDEEESDIADDPLLSALNDDLKAALRTTDDRLFYFIAAALIFAFLPKYVGVPSWGIYSLALLSGVSVIGGIGYAIWSSIQKQRAVASRYGLECSACGRKPKVMQIMQAAELRKCPWCRSILDVHPSSRRTNG
jgi:hypothetical protein